MISFIIPCRNEPLIHNVVEIIEELYPGSEVIISSDRESRGKGWAVKQAVPITKNNIICIIDGDLDINPCMLDRLIPFLAYYDIVVGKKVATGGLSRKILTILSRLYIRLLFNISVDTQTGIKLFRRYALLDFYTNSFAYDIEILYRAKLCKFTMCEIPVVAYISDKMPIKSIIKTLLDSWRIRWVITRAN